MAETLQEEIQRLGDNAVGLLKKLAPGRLDLIYSALSLQLIQLVGVIYGEKAARLLVDVLQKINTDFTPKFPSA